MVQTWSQEGRILPTHLLGLPTPHPLSTLLYPPSPPPPPACPRMPPTALDSSVLQEVASAKLPPLGLPHPTLKHI